MKINLSHRTDVIPQKKLVGLSTLTSFQDDQTALLWKKFMMRRKEISNRVSANLFSLQIYPANFSPHQPFTKYALAEVSDFADMPEEFETFELQSGKYLVFNYKGKAENGPEIFRYIFQNFLPENNLEVDSRPHFEIFGEDYNPNDDSAQEEIWIPVK